MIVTTMLSGTIMASDSVDMDDALLKRGYPKTVVDMLLDECKTDLYNSETEFCSANITYMDEDTGEQHNISFNNDEIEDDIATYAQIDSNDLYFLTVTTTKMNGSYLGYVKVTTQYDWESVPVSRFEDQIGVVWDPDVFEIHATTFVKKDKFSADVKYAFGEPSYTVGPFIQSEDTYPMEMSDCGVKWGVDLAGYNTYPFRPAVVYCNPVSLYGYGSFELNPIDTRSTSGSTKLYYAYSHEKVVWSASMPISQFGNISASGSGQDSIAKATQIKW